MQCNKLITYCGGVSPSGKALDSDSSMHRLNPSTTAICINRQFCLTDNVFYKGKCIWLENIR